MAARPGELDFSALAAEARKELDKPEPSNKAEKKVVIARSESTLPSPEHASVDSNDDNDTPFEEPVIDTSTEDTDDNVHTASQSSDATVQTNNDGSQELVDADGVELPDDHKVKVKIDGEIQVLRYGDFKNTLRKEATITQRMQNFAKSREEFNNEVAHTVQALEAREAALAQTKAPDTNAQALQMLADVLSGKTPAKPKDPNEILNYGELQAELQRQRDEFEQVRLKDKEAMDTALQQAALGVQEQNRINRERQQFFTGVDSLLSKDEYKIVNDVIPHMRAHVMSHVHTVGAQNLDEALEAAEDYIKERQAVLKKLTVAQEQQKQKTAAKQKMESNDGSPTTIARRELSNVEKGKKFIGKNGKLDFAAMQREALASMNAMN